MTQHHLQSMIKRTIHISVFAMTLCATYTANGGGLEFPDLGTVAIGRGGAFVAKADNPSAFHYNPAGLSKAHGKDLLLSVHLVNLNVDYKRYGSGQFWINGAGGQLVDTCPAGELCIADPALDYSAGTPREYEKVSMKKLGALPMLVFNWGDFAKVKGLALSIGLLPPSSFGTPAYPSGGPQRYAIIDANLLTLFPGAGISYSFNRYFQIGGVFLSGFGKFEQSLYIRPLPSVASTTNNEGAGGDAKMTMEAVDPFIPTGIFGILSNPVDWLELGASVKLPAKISADGTIQYTAPSQDMANSYMEEGRDKVNLKQHFPLSARIGARYIHSKVDVELDFVWEHWSSLEGFEISPDAVIIDPISDTVVTETPMPDTELPKNFRDTWSLRLGSDFQVWQNHLALRVGTFYQSSAYPKNNETFNLDFPFSQQIGVTCGFSWQVIKHLDIHLGYAHIFQPDVEVNGAIVQQQGLPLSTGEAIGNTINGGMYEVNLNIFSIGAEGHF